MAESILCPVCGETNPPDMEFCRNCQSRLLPVSGVPKRETGPIQPGELPTKKVTSELEPLLPQWLRDARQQARDSVAEDRANAEKTEAQAPDGAASDLLAGLASQAKEDDDEIPEWLSDITGAQSTKKKLGPEENQVKWVELGHAEEPQKSSLDVESPEAKSAAPAKDELTDWFRQAAASSEAADFRTATPPQVPGPTASDETQSPSQAAEPAESEELAWLRSLDAAAAAPREEAPAAPAELPDWLKKLQAEQTASESPQSAETEPASIPQPEVPDWLRSFGEETPATTALQTPPAEEPGYKQQLPDWIAPAASPASQIDPGQHRSDEILGPTELPDWLSSLRSSQDEPLAQEATGTTSHAFEVEDVPASPSMAATDVPDWLSALGSVAQPPAEEEGTPVPPAFTAEEPAVSAEPSSPGLPDWLSSLRAEQGTSEEETAPAFPPAAESPSLTEEPTAPDAALAPEALSGADADAVFASLQTPDWLSAVLPTSETLEEGSPAVAPEDEAIGPAELPSWVQAMRPVESAMAGEPSASEDVATESRGPLAGLRGVLPSIPGAAEPSGKPKPYSVKLDATEQQQAHAALLEQILAAETSPVPMRSAGELLKSQRLLRWVVSALVIALLGGAVFARAQSFQLPGGVPNETVGAIQSVESVPVDAPVLVVFDYQPATVGEMEATGASLLDHLLLLRHPRLVLLSTSPTGAALAERFMSTTLADRAYSRGTQYVDLGYLPGGLAGIYNFAQNPSAAVPLDAGSHPVWQSAILAPVQRFSDFAAIIVLTDSVESGRTWVEQTQAARGKSLMVLVSSAQAGPMLLPYFDSGQVNGMVAGLYGAAGAEQQNAGVPGFVRRYWDAYSLGLYLAALLIVLGGLWSLWLQLRDRRTSAVG